MPGEVGLDHLQLAGTVRVGPGAGLDGGEPPRDAGHGGDVAGAADLVRVDRLEERELAAGRLPQVMDEQHADAVMLRQAGQEAQQRPHVLDRVLALAHDRAEAVDDHQRRLRAGRPSGPGSPGASGRTGR